MREAGIQNLSGDFIYALPFQTIEELKTDLTFALSLELDHLSYYSLILEEKTLLERQVRLKEVSSRRRSRSRHGRARPDHSWKKPATNDTKPATTR
ncbi:MAG: hypothetical protein MZU79_05945 [Anaerotruncus sp.]|nr:hypothetical protein [Anaerotruncus sp.]